MDLTMCDVFDAVSDPESEKHAEIEARLSYQPKVCEPSTKPGLYTGNISNQNLKAPTRCS